MVQINLLLIKSDLFTILGLSHINTLVLNFEIWRSQPFTKARISPYVNTIIIFKSSSHDCVFNKNHGNCKSKFMTAVTDCLPFCSLLLSPSLLYSCPPLVQILGLTFHFVQHSLEFVLLICFSVAQKGEPEIPASCTFHCNSPLFFFCYNILHNVAKNFPHVFRPVPATFRISLPALSSSASHRLPCPSQPYKRGRGRGSVE